MDSRMKRSGGLKAGFTPLGIWAFSIGTSTGWGSFIVTCNTYLQKSGLLGTVFGLLLGMTVIFVIAWNLQYMIRKAPDAFSGRAGSVLFLPAGLQCGMLIKKRST